MNSLDIKGLIDKSALLIIDMQNDFVLEGAPVPCVPPRNLGEIISNISLVKEKLKARGVPVIYTREAHRKSGMDRGREADSWPLHGVEGTPGIEIVPNLRPAKGDYVIDKRRFSCFFQTDLLGLLKGLGTELIVLTGVDARVCVLSTAIDAYQYDFHSITIPDCISSDDGLLNSNNLRDLLKLYEFYSNLMSLNEFLTHLEERVHV